MISIADHGGRHKVWQQRLPACPSPYTLAGLTNGMTYYVALT